MRQLPLYLLMLAVCAGQMCAPVTPPDLPADNTDNGTGTDTTPADTSGDGADSTPVDTDIEQPTGAVIADYQTANDFANIPDRFIGAAKSNLNIYYGHTSHGNQVLVGMDMLLAEDARFAYNAGAGTLRLTENEGVDLGHEGDTGWADTTRAALAGGSYNMVVWSWCAGVSDNTEAGINTYLNTMSQLESDCPGVVFVYMTGHLDGTGPDGNLEMRNEQIRAYCRDNAKILFDFADIEARDPTGVYYSDGTDYCEWCVTWCSAFSCPSCTECDHSVCFNCYRKGRAFWWLLARLSGWNGVSTE